MIQLTNTSNLYTYIFGEYITVAQNNTATLEFTETNTDCTLTSITPSTVSLPVNPTSLTSVTVTSVLDCAPEDDESNSATYYYEVVSPKVIYNRVNESTSIVFTDVTTVETYDHVHDIPVTNNTWIENPGIRGAILIQKLDEDSNTWNTLGYMPIGGQLTLTSLDETLCQYRAVLNIRAIEGCGGHSPLIFEAIGETFTVRGRYYEEANPYLKEIIGDELKSYYCKKEKILTVEINQQLQIMFDSYNIDYTYQYFFSETNTDLRNFLYNSPSMSLVGSGVTIFPCALQTVTFYGCENEFIDGILETQTCAANPTIINGDYNEDDYNEDNYLVDEVISPTGPGVYTETFEYTLEVIRPNIIEPVIQTDCTYCVTVVDDTAICNPCMSGTVEYQYKTLNGDDWCEIKTIETLQTFTQCLCSADTYLLRNRYTYIEKGCGCNPDKLVFQTEWYEYDINLLEYKPTLDLEDTECCYIEGSEFTIQPTILTPNNTFCTTNPVLTYSVFDWNKELKIWEEVGALQTTYTIDLTNANWNNLEQYILTLTNLELKPYKVIAELTNCCSTTKIERYINMCPALQIVKDCDPEFIKDNREADSLPCDCTLYHITNHSIKDTYTIDVYHTGFKAIVDTITIAPLDSIEYKFTDDGIYTFTVNNITNTEVEKFVLIKYMFCKIDKCFTDLLKDILCAPANTDCLCEDQDVKKDRDRLNKMMTVYQTWMRFIEKEYNLNVRYTPIDITYRLKEFVEDNSVYNKMLNLCEPCADNTNGCCS